MNELEDIRNGFAEQKIAIVMPTYNNVQTVGAVITALLPYCGAIFVVNDGSTDGTLAVLRDFGSQITLISYDKNRGKGYALKCGFRAARAQGFRYAITIDSDGQHKAHDLPKFLTAIKENEDSILLGSRTFDHENMPQKSKFANRFSNFWFRVQTAKKVQDTQTGFRLYPIQKMGNMAPITSRYEAELELLVRCAWRGFSILEVPIHVFYPKKEERVSHFRPKIDFLRISILNTFLCIFAIFYGYPALLIRKICKK